MFRRPACCKPASSTELGCSVACVFSRYRFLLFGFWAPTIFPLSPKGTYSPTRLPLRPKGTYCPKPKKYILGFSQGVTERPREARGSASTSFSSWWFDSWHLGFASKGLHLSQGQFSFEWGYMLGLNRVLIKRPSGRIEMSPGLL